MKKLFSFIILTLLISFNSSAKDKYPIILEAATPEEVTSIFVQTMSQQLDNCFEFYKKENDPKVKLITLKVLEAFRSNYPYDGKPSDNYCYETFSLKEMIESMFQEKDRKQASPQEIQSWMNSWTLDKLEKGTVNGIIKISNKWKWLMFYDAIKKAQDENAMNQVEDPKNTSYRWIRKYWDKEVHIERSESNFLNPIIFDPEILETKELFNAMEKYFYLKHLSLTSTEKKALYDFWEEVTSKHNSFFPLLKVLETNGFKKFFYFTGGGDDWNRQVLLILDEHGQMFGFDAIYSE